MLKEYFQEEEILKLKNIDNLFYKSLELVTRLFNNKTDKGGLPYSIHLLKVYSGVNDEKDKICALLHDVVENTSITFDDLESIDFPKEIIDILTILTKKKGEDYQKYIERIIKSSNYHAMNVKLADLEHNMDITRIKNPTINDYERIEKRYRKAYEKILDKINKIEVK